jgi:adenylosuccinate synthase
MESPAQASGYDKIEAVYRKIPGWRSSTEGITKFDKLPRAAQEYLGFLEEEAGAKIGMVSTGPDRDHTIFVDEFAAELETVASRKV